MRDSTLPLIRASAVFARYTWGLRLACLLTTLAPLTGKAVAMAADPTLTVAYGPDAQQSMDLYLPSEKTDQPRPVVLWIHGGGWREGDKQAPPNGISTFADRLLAGGFIAAACNYRLAPQHPHPAQLDDVQRAVRWLRAHAEEHHLDPERIGAVGISAGGHLACFLAVRDTHEPGEDELSSFSSRVRAACALAAPTDLRPIPEVDQPVLRSILPPFLGAQGAQDEATLADASPITFVDRNAAPTRFVTGLDDPWILPIQSRRMSEALKSVEVASDVIEIRGAGHAIFPSIQPRARVAALEWMTTHLQPRPDASGRGASRRN